DALPILWIKPEAIATDHSALLLQENLPVDFNEWTTQYYDQTIAALVQLSAQREQGSEDVHLVIWPESPAPFYSADPNFHRWMMKLASDTHSYLIVGSLGVDPANNTQ